MKHLFAALVVSLAATGCAALRPEASFTAFGEADPARDKAVVTVFDKAIDEDVPNNSGAKVLIDTIPDGVEIEKGSIKVREGAPHQIIGKFTIRSGGHFFPRYKAGWKKGLCYPQMPLVVATLITWAVVPTFWPCLASAMTPLDLIEASKTLAVSSGANLVLLSYVGDPSTDSVQGGTGFLLKTEPEWLDPNRLKPRPKTDSARVSGTAAEVVAHR